MNISRKCSTDSISLHSLHIGLFALPICHIVKVLVEANNGPSTLHWVVWRKRLSETKCRWSMSYSLACQPFTFKFETHKSNLHNCGWMKVKVWASNVWKNIKLLESWLWLATLYVVIEDQNLLLILDEHHVYETIQNNTRFSSLVTR